MRVQLTHSHRYYLNGQLHEGKAGEVVDLPEYMARGCVGVGHGQLLPEKGRALHASMNKMASVEETKDDEPDDFTLLPHIGKSNAAKIIDEGVTTYRQLWQWMRTDAGRSFLLALPRINGGNLPAIRNEIIKLLER